MGVGALWHSAIARLFLGDEQGFGARRARALELTDTLNNATTTLYTGLWAAFTSVVTEDWSKAQETASRMIGDAEERSMALWVAFGRHFLGCAYVGLAEHAAGIAAIHRAREDAALLENRIFLPMTLCFEARALAALHRPGEALARLNEAAVVVETTDERWWEAEIHRGFGEIMLLNGASSNDCESKFRRAIEIASKQGAKLLEKRAASSLLQLTSGGAAKVAWR
jgi:predicted ATPase